MVCGLISIFLVAAFQRERARRELACLNGQRFGRAVKRFALLALGFAVLLALAAVPARASEPGFAGPQRVTILGYDGDAMEPFITRDGRYLLFNNRNDPPDTTDLFYAERVDARTFRFRGPLAGANSLALDAVASVDCSGTLYFVSPRSYGATFSTIYRAHFANGVVSGVELAPGISQRRAGAVNFDAEISPDGRTLFVVESDFDPVRGPQSARIAMFSRRGQGFVREPESDRLLQAVNTAALQYAPSISADGRDLYFTRPAPGAHGSVPALYLASRRDRRSAFGEPTRIRAAQGFVEGPSLSPDGRSLYYHALRDGRFVIERLVRKAARLGAGASCARSAG